jgi:hypothetical protein
MSCYLFYPSGFNNLSNFLRSFSLDEKEPNRVHLSYTCQPAGWAKAIAVAQNHGKIKSQEVFDMINDVPSNDLNGTTH